LEDEDIKKSAKQDINVLSNSLMTFKEIFVDSDLKNIKEFFISTEDMLLKFLNFLEFWIQKNTHKESVVFIIKALGRIIKNAENDDDEEKREKLMIERQDMFDRLNATRIFIALIWDEKRDDTVYLYALFKFMISLLKGGNKTV